MPKTAVFPTVSNVFMTVTATVSDRNQCVCPMYRALFSNCHLSLLSSGEK